MSSLKLLGRDSQDLSIISASLQDAIIRIQDIAYNKSSRSLSLQLWRYRHEADRRERVLCGLRLDNILSLQSKGISRNDPKAYIVLLSIEFEAGDVTPSGVIHLNFAGGGTMRLGVEAIDVILADISDPHITDKVPLHPDAIL